MADLCTLTCAQLQQTQEHTTLCQLCLNFSGESHAQGSMLDAFYLYTCSVDASVQKWSCPAAWYMASLHRQLLLQIIA